MSASRSSVGNTAIVHLNKAFRSGDESGGRPRPIFTSFILNRLAEPYVFSSHVHKEFEVLFIQSGEYRCQLNGVDMQFGDNSVLVVQPGDVHEDYCEPPLVYAGLCFNLYCPNAGLNKLRFFGDAVTPQQQGAGFSSSVLLPLLDQIAEEARRRDTVSGYLQDALMGQLFWYMVRAFSAEVLASWIVPDSPDKRFNERLMQCFVQNMHCAPSVAEMARAMGVSARTLNQRCASLMGISPAKAFMRFKVQQAQYMLRHTSMSVKEAAYRMGFANPYHFSRVYRKEMGHAPSSDKVQELP